MSNEVERRLKCLSFYPDPPAGLAAAVLRARALAEPEPALIDLERVCLAAQIGVIRRDRVALELEDARALAPPALLRGMLDRLNGALPERMRAALLRRIYAALPEAQSWNLREFALITLSLPPDAAKDGETARLHRALSAALGAGLLAPKRVAERLAGPKAPRGYGPIVRWVERTGAPVLPADRDMRELPTPTARVIRRRHEEMVRLLAEDLRLQ